MDHLLLSHICSGKTFNQNYGKRFCFNGIAVKEVCVILLILCDLKTVTRHVIFSCHENLKFSSTVQSYTQLHYTILIALLSNWNFHNPVTCFTICLLYISYLLFCVLRLLHDSGSGLISELFQALISVVFFHYLIFLMCFYICI